MQVINPGYLPEEFYKLAYHYNVDKLVIVPPNKVKVVGYTRMYGRYICNPDTNLNAIYINPLTIASYDRTRMFMSDKRLMMWLSLVKVLLHEVGHKNDTSSNIIDNTQHSYNKDWRVRSYIEERADWYAEYELGRLLRLHPRCFMPSKLKIMDVMLEPEWKRFSNYNFTNRKYTWEDGSVSDMGNVGTIPFLEFIRCLKTSRECNLQDVMSALVHANISLSRRRVWRICLKHNIGKVYVDKACRRHLFFTISEADKLANVIVDNYKYNNG